MDKFGRFGRKFSHLLSHANLMFQKEKIDPQNAFEELTIAFKSNLRRISNSHGGLVVLELTNFGIELDQMNPPIDVKQRCRDFLDELAKQLNDRIQSDLDSIISLSLLSPKHLLSGNKPHF